MEIVSLFLALVALVSVCAAAFVAFHICRSLLHWVNDHRKEQEKKQFTDRTINVLSVLCGLTFLL